MKITIFSIDCISLFHNIWSVDHFDLFWDWYFQFAPGNSYTLIEKKYDYN